MANKIALVVGIDNYIHMPALGSCVEDARAVAKLLAENAALGDDVPGQNFEIVSLTSDETEVSTNGLVAELKRVFAAELDTLLFYFSGHGDLNESTGNGVILASDGQRHGPSISFADLIGYCRNATNIRSKILILDCCNSGGAGDIHGDLSVLPSGTTIMAASQADEAARQTGSGHSVFTSLLLSGLDGGAADLMGRVTPASLYAHIDQSLGPLEQRPTFKANVKDFVEVRRAEPSIKRRILYALKTYFPEPDAVYPLGPHVEPPKDRGVFQEAFADIPFDKEAHAKYRDLQACARANLVRPIGVMHMWDAAMNKDGSPGCVLTHLGKHYRNLALRNRLE